MSVRIANRKTQIRLRHQKQSDLGLRCLSRPFLELVLKKFRMFTVIVDVFLCVEYFPASGAAFYQGLHCLHRLK